MKFIEFKKKALEQVLNKKNIEFIEYILTRKNEEISFNNFVTLHKYLPTVLILNVNHNTNLDDIILFILENIKINKDFEDISSFYLYVENSLQKQTFIPLCQYSTGIARIQKNKDDLIYCIRKNYSNLEQFKRPFSIRFCYY